MLLIKSYKIRMIRTMLLFIKLSRFLTLNKPIYVGFTVLEVSKWLMYKYHYIFTKYILMLNCYLLTQAVLLMK